ncbi:homeobox-domain-containing protein [Russula earlei]|uniref:Homeobox-domain-containing protein n=1 Tax=Russula earlei TaxID=71964 RepID=A0ACC0UML4_9AGAM|nr:homeobox-domain-containing protein [Russula earlei]
MAPTLSRSESSSSLGSSSSSSDERLSVPRRPTTTAKRTRKRFTGSQVAMLEQLFHRASHPSREEREALARDLDLEPKVVTIWFQNRRQNERRASLNSAATRGAGSEPTSSSPTVRGTSSQHRTPRASVPHASFSSPYAHPSPAAAAAAAETSLLRRPTLETMARRTELRTAPQRTPSKRPDPNKSPWDNMPSSPLAPPSPPEQEFVQFAMGRRRHARSLEWACAAARLVGKRAAVSRHDDADDDETDEDETITPMGSLIGDAASDVLWEARSVAAKRVANREKPKDLESELMDAALLLCGLGRKVA